MHPVAFVLALGVVVFLHTVVGEMVPKNLTLAGPERRGALARPADAGVLRGHQAAAGRDEVGVRGGSCGSGGSRRPTRSRPSSPPRNWPGWSPRRAPRVCSTPEEHARITGALALHDRTAGGRAAAVGDGDHGGRGRLAGVAGGAGDPDRPVPVPGGAAGDPPGARLRARQGRARVRRAAAAGRRFRPTLIRPLAVVPPDRTLADLLLAMRRERRHIVLVSDGRRPLGVVTLDDVLTAIVG